MYVSLLPLMMDGGESEDGMMVVAVVFRIDIYS